MTADEIERTTMAHLHAMREGLPPHRVRALESEILALHETLVRNVAWYFRRRYIYQTSTIDDLYQAGRLGVLSAIRSFDPKKSQVFGMHAYSRIRRALQQATIEERLVRVEGTKNQRNYWAPPLHYGDDVGAVLCEEVGDLRDDVEAAARAREVERHDLTKPDRVTVRRIRRRLRMQGLA